MHEIFAKLLDLIFPPKPRTEELELLAKQGALHTLKASPETPYPFMRALFHYKDPLVRALIWEIKYANNPRLVHAAGKLLHQEILAYFEEHASFAAGSWIIVPIPSSKAHFHEKGFNQADELAKAIVQCDKGGSFRRRLVLVKTRETESQAKVNRSRRLKNLVEAYEVRDEKSVRGKSVIVVDDVTTTGSTFVEARRALKKAGAKRVIALSVAH